MARPLNPADLDNAIERYLTGEPFQQIQATTGVALSTFHRERARRGIPPRSNTLVMPDAEIAAAYQAGESEYSLSLRYNTSRPVIRRRLEQVGIEIRGMSEAGKVRAAKMTPEEREAQAAAAHNASRGSKRSDEQLRAHALALEAIGRFGSPAERKLHGWLAARGVNAVPQKAIGKYNVDLAVAPIAVEILGGGWHLEKRSHATRTPQILDAGWHLAFVWDHEGDSALSQHAADYVVGFLDEVRRQPTAVSQYRVISGNGELLAAGRRDDDQFALVPPPRGRKAIRT